MPRFTDKEKLRILNIKVNFPPDFWDEKPKNFSIDLSSAGKIEQIFESNNVDFICSFLEKALWPEKYSFTDEELQICFDRTMTEKHSAIGNLLVNTLYRRDKFEWVLHIARYASRGSVRQAALNWLIQHNPPYGYKQYNPLVYEAELVEILDQEREPHIVKWLALYLVKDSFGSVTTVTYDDSTISYCQQVLQRLK